MPPRRFSQLDVFSSGPCSGNPLAVVHDAAGLSDTQLQQFAAWTNLSETTFLLPPTKAGADYRVRIFTPREELPFAGHPTLGSAPAWLSAGGQPRACGGGGRVIVQQCGAGLVRIRDDGTRLAFAAPPLTRYGPVEPAVLRQVLAGLRLGPGAVAGSSWLVNGPRWIGLRLGSAAEVLALRPDYRALGDLEVGVVGPHPPGSGPDFEIRTFVGSEGIEDPVTGSFNAGAARWLIDNGWAPQAYLAAQGTVLGRTGRIHVEQDAQTLWIGGESRLLISGTVDL